MKEENSPKGIRAGAFRGQVFQYIEKQAFLQRDERGEKHMAEQRDDALQLEQDLARVIGVKAPIVHRAVAHYTADTGDPFAPLLMSLYWLYRENKQEHPIYQRFQSYLAQTQKEVAAGAEKRLYEEGAYRRGYQQGMGACYLYVLKQLERGKTKEEISARLAKWDKDLGDWRMALDAQGTEVHPPEPSW